MGVKKVLDFIETVLIKLVCVLLAAMTLVITYQVIMRYLFQSSTIWAEEFARYAFIWVVMMGSVIAMRRMKHIRIDFVIERLSPKVRKVFDLFSMIIMAIFVVCLLINGVKIVMQTGNQISTGLHIPISYMYSSIPISCFLMLLFILENVYNDYFMPDRKDSNNNMLGEGGNK